MTSDESRASLGWREHLAPLPEERSYHDEDGSDESSHYESDWEAEVNAKGEVFYVLPVEEKEMENFNLSSSKTGEEKRVKKEKVGSKLSRLVRRRESKRDRSMTDHRLVSTDPGAGVDVSSDGDSSTYGQIKTFESFFEGTSPVELIDVHMRLVSVKSRPELSVSLLEQSLGIIPGHNEQPSEDAPFTANRVIIAGFLTDGPAIKHVDKLKVGDWIRSIDGHQVTLDNVHSVLSRYSSSCKVKITVQRSSVLPALVEDDEQMITPPSVIKIVTGQGPSPADVQSMLKKLPYIALYITRRGITESSPELADVLYQFPSQHQSKLLQVRGMFLTLCHALPEITGSRPITSSIIVEEQLVHVGYAEEREDLFILALPATKCSAKEVSQVVRDVVRVLRLQYKTLSRAFSPKHAGDLNDFFSIQFLDLLVNIQSVTSSRPLLDMSRVLTRHSAKFDQCLPAAHWLHLPDDVKYQIDDALSQLEAGDFQDYSDEFYDLPREFNILGSCLFHKGFLLASHLPRDDMVDILLWCQYHQVLPLTKQHPVHQLVNWCQVFPTKQSNIAADTSSESVESDKRVFLLVVGVGHQVLGVLLETGGCAALHGAIVPPDPFYVDQAENTLEHLIEMGIPSVCNKWLTLPPNPDIVDIDLLYQSQTSHNKRLDLSSLEQRRAAGAGGVVLRKTKTTDYASTESPNESLDDTVSLPPSHSDDGGHSELSEERHAPGHWPDDEHDDEDDEDGETPDDWWSLYRSGNKSQLEISDNDNTAGDNDEEDVVTYQVSQLSISPSNTIFHFLHLDVGEGVFLAPLRPPPGKYHTSVLENFRAACQIIHSSFQMTIRSKDSVKSRQEVTRPWLNKSLVVVKEQGMLFHYSPSDEEESLNTSTSSKKNMSVLSYWVAGRLFLSPQPRECYVCYHDSAPQVMIELAFRLAFGALL